MLPLNLLTIFDPNNYKLLLDKIITDNYNHLQDVEYDMESVKTTDIRTDVDPKLFQKTGRNLSVKRQILPKVHLYIDNNHNFKIFYNKHRSAISTFFFNLSQDVDLDIYIDNKRWDLDTLKVSSDKTNSSYTTSIHDIVSQIDSVGGVSMIISDLLDLDIKPFRHIDDLYFISFDMDIVWSNYNLMYTI